MDQKSVLIFLVTLAVTFAVSTAQNKETFNDGKFSVGWKLEDKSIIFTVEVTGVDGWIGVGFSHQNQAMKDAYIVVGELNGGTTLDVHDYWSTEVGRPAQKAKTDLEEVTSSRNESTKTSVMTFRRKLDSGETNQDIALPNNGIYILWAVGNQAKLNHHAQRGYSTAKVKFDAIATDAETEPKGTNAGNSVKYSTILLITPLLCIITIF